MDANLVSGAAIALLGGTLVFEAYYLLARRRSPALTWVHSLLMLLLIVVSFGICFVAQDTIQANRDRINELERELKGKVGIPDVGELQRDRWLKGLLRMCVVVNICLSAAYCALRLYLWRTKRHRALAISDRLFVVAITIVFLVAVLVLWQLTQSYVDRV